MFRFTQEPSSGSKRQYLAKITNMVSTVLVHTNAVSIMGAYWGLLCVRVVYRTGRD
jgi:rRNA processing protein Krr1/Pno1